MNRHIAILRSICEGFGGKPLYCQCGLQITDPIHFKTDELENKEFKQKQKDCCQ